MFLQVSVCPQGGRCTPPRQTPPWVDTPPGRHPPLGRHPPSGQTPPSRPQTPLGSPPLRNGHCSGRYAFFFNTVFVFVQASILLRIEDSLCTMAPLASDKGCQLPLQEVCPPTTCQEGEGNFSIFCTAPVTSLRNPAIFGWNPMYRPYNIDFCFFLTPCQS